MDQHPIPRQITTFEFKLIGFMTLKQFLFLVVFFPVAYLVYSIFPIPVVNILLGVIIAGIGLGFAFFQIQDRPVDVWIRNFIKRLRSPTQYFYHKQNDALPFLKGLFFDSDPHIVMAHIDSQEKLSAYLAQKKSLDSNKKQKEHIQNMLKQPIAQVKKATVTSSVNVTSTTATQTDRPNMMEPDIGPPGLPPPQKTQQPAVAQSVTVGLKHPFLTGVIRNNRQIALPGVLVYMKDQQENTLRLLKTNPHGVFATYSPLPPGEYVIEMKDPNSGYFFDTMKVKVEAENPTPLKFYSKELL